MQRVTNGIKNNSIYMFLQSKQAYLLILRKILIIHQLMSLIYANSWKDFHKSPKNIVTELKLLY